MAQRGENRFQFNWISIDYVSVSPCEFAKFDEKCWVGRPIKLNTIKSISQYATPLSRELCAIHALAQLCNWMNECDSKLTISKAAITNINFWEYSSRMDSDCGFCCFKLRSVYLLRTSTNRTYTFHTKSISASDLAGVMVSIVLSTYESARLSKST